MRDQPTTNVWELLGRQRKVSRLVETLDTEAESAGGKPHTSDASAIADALSVWLDSDWISLCQRASVKVLSPETRAAVIAVYVERKNKWRSQRVAQIEAKLNDPTVDPIEKNALEEELMRSWSSEAR